MRSQQWYRGTDRNAYIHRAWMRRGLPAGAFDGRPHIAIANTASDLTPCNMHLTEVARSVKDGIWAAGGIPLELPVMSLGETQVRPTAMLWRNLAAMSIEEMLRANPIDGVVLLGGCDKTIPSLLMAAASVDLPSVVIPGGPMLTGTFRGQPLGCDVQQIELAGFERALGVARLERVLRRVEERRAHTELAQRADLVLHQRDQRRDDDRRALAQQRRHLVAQRLAAAGRHQHQRIAATRDMGDDFALRTAKRLVAEGGAQDLERAFGAVGHRNDVGRSLHGERHFAHRAATSPPGTAGGG